MTTAVLILNWNGSADTVRCLADLKPLLTEEDYVFVIDNGSSDNSVQTIGDHFTSTGTLFKNTEAKELKNVFDPACRFYLVRNGSNLGFGAGNNTVLKQLRALSHPFELAWLLNNDAVAETGALSSLKTAFRNEKKTGAAGSLILNDPARDSIQCSGVKYYKFLGVSKLINKNKALSGFDPNEPITFDYLNGASLLLRVDAVEQAGFFDERFFLYSEEFDLQLNMQALGYTLRLVPESRVFHKLAGGTSKSRFLFYFYYNTSAVLLSRKHFSAFHVFCALFSLTGITFIRTFLSLKNFWWGLKGIAAGLTK